MLNENQVVEAVCDHLQGLGCSIIQKCDTNARGIDIIAENPGRAGKLYLEAKGGISSKETSSDFGNPFGKGKVRHQVAFGVYTALKMHTENLKDAGDRVGIAFPDSPAFRHYLAPVKPILDGIGVLVLLVEETGKVNLFSRNGVS